MIYGPHSVVLISQICRYSTVQLLQSFMLPPDFIFVKYYEQGYHEHLYFSVYVKQNYLEAGLFRESFPSHTWNPPSHTGVRFQSASALHPRLVLKNTQK